MTKIKQPNGQLEKVNKTVRPDLHREKTRKPLFRNFWVQFLKSPISTKEQRKSV